MKIAPSRQTIYRAPFGLGNKSFGAQLIFSDALFDIQDNKHNKRKVLHWKAQDFKN